MRCRFLKVALLFASSVGCAAGVDHASVPVSVVYGYGSDADSSMQGQLEALPRVELSLGENTSFVLSGRIRLDAKDELEPGMPDLDTYAPLASPATLGDAGTFEVRDAFLEYRLPGGVARFGKQQIVWGRLDGIKVLDVVDPQEFREFILDELGDSRIGLWSAYLDLSLGAWRTELAVVPDGTGHAIPEPGAWFELTAPRFRYGAAPGSPTPPIRTVQPGHGLDEAGFGLRLSRRFGNLGASAVAWSGRDPEPLGRIVAEGDDTLLERYYERRDVFGVSAETAFGALVVRAEYGWQPDRYFNTRTAGELAAVPLDQHRGVLALDIDGPLGVFINAQYLVDAVHDAPADLVRPATDRIATVFLRRSFGYDKLDAELRWYHSFEDADDLVALAVQYDLAPNTQLKFAVEAFEGTAVGLFGQFEERDRITLGIEHTF